MKDYDNPSHYPENPPWTMFFDGPLYEKYKEFMANKDFSKILLTSKLQLANQKDNIPNVPHDHVGIDWWSMDHDNNGKDNPVASDTYNTVSDTFYRKFTRGKKEEKRRTRRTRAVILLIILVLLAVSLGTALIIHYFLVPKDDDIAPAQVNISFSGNTSIFGMTEDVTSTEIPSTIKPTTLSVSTVDTHEIDKVKDILNRGGRLFEDTTRSNVTAATTQITTKQSTKSTNITTTTTVDPFDFFSMDENMTTTAQQNQTTTTGTILKTTDPKPMTASTTPPSKTNSTPTTETTTQTTTPTITTQQQTSPETDTPSTTASVETTSPTVGTSSTLPAMKTSTLATDSGTTDAPTTESATVEVTTTDDVSIETTTEQRMSTAQMEQITEISTTPITTASINETTKTVSTTPISTTANKIDTLEETTTDSLTTTKAVEPPQTTTTTTMSVTTTIPTESTTTISATTTASPTTSSKNNKTTTETETTTLDIGTEIVTTTQVAPTTTEAPIVTPTSGSTAAPSTTVELTTGTGESVTTPDSLANATITDVVTPTTSISAFTDETTFETTTSLPQTTTEVMPHLDVQDLTAYKTDTAQIKCHVTNLGEFKSLSIIEDKYWSPVEVTLYSSGETDWFFTKTDRHHVTHEFRNISGSYLRELTVIFDIENIQCKDAGGYKCTVNTRSHEVTKSAKLTVVGRPDKQVKIQLGPSIIEDRAFRVTAIWQAGYPTPWSNMSWMALDARNQTYNLEDYGEYRDYELKVDHFECETFLESAIVIFPKVHLNDTTVIVKPDMDTTRSFVDDDMRKYLASVEYGIEKIRVIPCTILKTTDPKPMTASITPAFKTDSTSTTATTPTTTQMITTQQQTSPETDTLTTTISVETTSPTVGTSSSIPVMKTSTLTTDSGTTEAPTTESATVEVTTSDDVPIETTTEQRSSTAQMEQITETSTTTITTATITESTKTLSTTPIPTTLNQIDALEETTTASLTTTKLVEAPQTTTMSVATAIPAESTTATVAKTTASSTTSSINNTTTTVTETTALDIGTEIVTTTQASPSTSTVAPIMTPTSGSKAAPSTTAEPTTASVESVTTPDNLANATNTDVVTPTTSISAVTDETTVETTTSLPQTTTEVMPHLDVQDLTAYKTDTAQIKCHVTNLGEFKSLSIIEDKYWSPVEVTLYSSGETDWFFTKTDRHHVTHEFRNISGSYLRELTVIFDIENIQCKDAGGYKCTVNTRSHEVTKSAKLTVVGRPDKQVKIQLGPSIIEDRAFRVTAIWQAGYPTPWSNMSWMALDARNQTYNLEDYGEYRDYELKVDHFECETFLESAIVIFPKVHLNDTTVIVKPDMDTTRSFVDDDMRKYLASVEYGIEKIRVIPLNYCPTVTKEVSIPHPYTECTKFIRCVPGNLHVQQCPTGTCFYERWQECL